MNGPVRLFYAIRPQASPGVLAAAIAVAALFAATPFAIPEVASRYGVSLGASGLISAVQVGGFALASFLAGRVARPGSRLLRQAALVALAANVLSVLTSTFAVLLVLRLAAGLAAGVLVWLAWTDALVHEDHMGDVAVAGPLAAVLASPILGALAGWGDDRALYAALAAACLPALVLPSVLPTAGPDMRRRSSSRSNRILLAALGLLTAFGSSLFVFAAAVGAAGPGLAPFTVSLAYSVNAAAGIAGTRFRARRGTGGWWLAATGLAAMTVALVDSPVTFFAAMGVWGFAFWMGVPEVFRRLAERSLTRGERAGDAQAAMALGRAFGPLLGGALVAGPGLDALGITAGVGMIGAGTLVAGVETHRERHAGLARAAA